MTNHPNRGRGPYTVRVSAHHTTGPKVLIRTMAEARAYAGEYGETADQMTVWDRDGEMAATYVREGLRWVRSDTDR